MERFLGPGGWRARIAVAADERRLAGVLSGALYATGGVTLALTPLFPGVSRAHWSEVIVIGAAALIWGALSMGAIDWDAAPSWLIHLSNLVALALIALGVAANGGSRSPAWILIFFVAVFASAFYPPPVALFYIAVSALVFTLPLLYDGRAVGEGYLAKLVLAVPALVAMAGAIIPGKRLLIRTRDRAQSLAAEQGALRNVATAVAAHLPADEIYALVAEEVAPLLGAHASGVLRFESGETARVMGAWSRPGGGKYEPGTEVPVRAGSDVERLLRTGRPVRVGGHPDGSPVALLGYRCSVIAPVSVNRETWGILALVHERPHGLAADTPERLTAFGDLLATAIANTEQREELAARASTDPLTGLANHRAFHERLSAELRRSERHGRPLSVAVIDVDHFKAINDLGGHGHGDRVLAEIAGCLQGMARAEDTLARIGGDEFAWILPESDALQAMGALERARQAIGAGGLADGRLTISAGICDTNATPDARRLFQLADGALYWSKAHGRDVCWIYDSEVVKELSAQERAEHLQRSQALVGLRALARAIDAKDPVTASHSERVSELAARLARGVGWGTDRVRLLAEAALVHDVGKIGVPDAVLFKAGPLSPDEYEQVKLHAELSARIVEDVLTPEQVDWIRSHHERPDGAGYPRGLSGREVPEGAGLLAIADAWDVMTLSRPYSAPKDTATALAECRALAGRHFTKRAVAALVALHALDGLAVAVEAGSDGIADR